MHLKVIEAQMCQTLCLLGCVVVHFHLEVSFLCSAFDHLADLVRKQLF